METSTSTELVPVDSVFADVEGLALAGFLAGYRGLTREAYALDPPPPPARPSLSAPRRALVPEPEGRRPRLSAAKG